VVTVVDAREAIYSRWSTQWVSSGAARTAFTFENDAFSEPDHDDYWARVTVLGLGGGQVSLGPTSGRKYRRLGSVIVQIFSPVDSGMTTSGGHAEAALDIFEGASFSNLCFNDGSIREVGVMPGEKWHLTNVEILFDFEETK